MEGPSSFPILRIFHPRGGCGAVAEAMARVARQLGCAIVLNEPVERIIFNGRRATGVQTPTGRHTCDALVINADFAQAMTRLVPDQLRRRWHDRALARKKFSCSTFMLYLGLAGACEELPHHTIFLAKDYRKNLAEIEERHILSENPSFYVHNPCRVDPGLAPEGMSALYVLAPVTHLHANVDWAREKKRFRDLMLRQLGKVGIKNPETRIRSETVITPLDWHTQMNLYRGAAFSLAHSLPQLLHLRPHNRFEELDRVYLAGGGTHPGSGLPVIFESARITAKLLAQDLGIHPQWEFESSAKKS